CDVTDRLRNGIEVLNEYPRGGRDPLHLRDDRDRRSSVTQRLEELIEGPAGSDLRPRTDLVVGHRRARGGDVRASLSCDLIQEVRHAVAAASVAPIRRLVATNRSRTSPARPRSIASAASLAPSGRSRASPAT